LGPPTAHTPPPLPATWHDERTNGKHCGSPLVRERSCAPSAPSCGPRHPLQCVVLLFVGALRRRTPIYLHSAHACRAWRAAGAVGAHRQGPSRRPKDAGGNLGSVERGHNKQGEQGVWEQCFQPTNLISSRIDSCTYHLRNRCVI
jgi:hypothetical protein